MVATLAHDWPGEGVWDRPMKGWGQAGRRALGWSPGRKSGEESGREHRGSCSRGGTGPSRACLLKKDKRRQGVGDGWRSWHQLYLPSLSRPALVFPPFSGHILPILTDSLTLCSSRNHSEVPDRPSSLASMTLLSPFLLPRALASLPAPQSSARRNKNVCFRNFLMTSQAKGPFCVLPRLPCRS